MVLWNTRFFPAYRQASAFLYLAHPISRVAKLSAIHSQTETNVGI